MKEPFKVCFNFKENRFEGWYQPQRPQYDWFWKDRKLVDNYEFKGSLRVTGFSKGRSSVKIHLECPKTNTGFEMFLSSYMDLTMKTKVENCVTEELTWTFCRKGTNHGLKAVL